MTDQTTPQNRPQIHEPEFLTNGFLHTPAGLAAFKKLPTSSLLDEYLACQIEGLIYFDKVFRGIAESQPSHKDIMIQHHRILSIGTNGKHNYPVSFSEEYSKDVSGKLRPVGGRVAFSVRDPKFSRAVLRALTEIDYFPDGWWDIQLDGIPEEAWSRAKRIKRGFNIEHPDGKHIPLYFSKMGECLEYLKYLQSKPAIDSFEIVRSLANYFHLGIHSHAFVRINQSLLWSQVNYILMLNNYNPVCHGYVDLVAAFLDTNHFCRYFERYISNNSTLMDNNSALVN